MALQNSSIDAAPKLVGIGFGHLAIAKSCGARVGTNRNDHHELKVTRLHLLSGMDKFIAALNQQYMDVSSSGVAAKRNFFEVFFPDYSEPIHLLELHNEHVLDIPDEAICLAYSDACKFEILSYGDQTLTLQGYPELTVSHAHDIILPTLHRHAQLSEDEMSKVNANLQLKLHGDCFVKLIQCFLGLIDVFGAVSNVDSGVPFFPHDYQTSLFETSSFELDDDTIVIGSLSDDGCLPLTSSNVASTCLPLLSSYGNRVSPRTPRAISLPFAFLRESILPIELQNGHQDRALMRKEDRVVGGKSE